MNMATKEEVLDALREELLPLFREAGRRIRDGESEFDEAEAPQEAPDALAGPRG